jgi:hypothetical protein
MTYCDEETTVYIDGVAFFLTQRPGRRVSLTGARFLSKKRAPSPAYEGSFG